MVFRNHINYCSLIGPLFATGNWFLQTIFIAKKMVFSNHINFYSLAKLFGAKEMVFANHINCYGPSQGAAAPTQNDPMLISYVTGLPEFEFEFFRF